MSVSAKALLSPHFPYNSHRFEPMHSGLPHQQGFDCTDHNNTASPNSLGGGGGGQPPPQNTANPNTSNEADTNNNARLEQGSGGTVKSTEGTGTGDHTIEDSRIYLPQQQMFPDEELHREELRLRTFDNPNWTVSFLDKKKLAQIGLYYLGTQDVVKCHFCGVEIGKWEQDDDCFTEHYRWSSSCPLLRRHLTNNVPIDPEALDRILPPVTYDTCGPCNGGVTRRPNAYAERSFTPNFDNEQASGSSSSEDEAFFGVQSPPITFGEAMMEQSIPPTVTTLATNTNAYYSPSIVAPPSFYSAFTHLEIEANRLKSFKEWPINLKMKPRELSDAGFFYTGMGDRVQCFSCGGGLKNWEDDDVAWEQHALWYGNCEYLKLIKGQKYINEVLEKQRRLQAENELEDDEDEEGDEIVEESEEGGEEGAAAIALRKMDESGASNSNSDRLGAAASSSRGAAEGITKMKRKKLQQRKRKVNKNCDAHPESDVRSSSSEAMLAASSKSEVPESKTCKICFECEFNTAFIPCGHVVACAKCASAVTKCPMCREPFDSVTRIYFS